MRHIKLLINNANNHMKDKQKIFVIRIYMPKGGNKSVMTCPKKVLDKEFIGEYTGRLSDYLNTKDYIMTEVYSANDTLLTITVKKP